MTQFLIFSLLIIIGLLAYFLIDTLQQMKGLKSALKRLTVSFDELDEQAKLIVKTDLELNKAQEELDKRLNGLDALQKTSRLISTTLDENEIFQRLNQPLLSELGFEKYLLYTLTEEKTLQNRVAIGFIAAEQTRITEHLKKNERLMGLLTEGHMLSSFKTPEDMVNLIIDIFKVRHFIITPILAQDSMIGILFAGNQSDAFAVTEGDKELLSILADQIGQAIETARLFEQVYRARQILEAKVQERTKELSSALEEVQRISQNKSEFISAVSHELRTPLTSIKGYASILITGKVGEIPDKVKERLEKINKHSDNLVKLINDLLDISRIESRKIEMKIVPYAILPVIENVHDLLTPQMKEKNINFVTDIPAHCPAIPMDLSQAERVFINLISNAIKFTPGNGTIKVAVTTNEKDATFSVSDTGIGIKEENIPNLFNEFYRVDNEINQNVKGTGLGLALAKKIVAAHGGKMWLTSQVHQGTTFYFTLPLAPKTNGAMSPAQRRL